MPRTRSRKGAPGIIEVAERAGVSPATVSRFYNSPDMVKGPTRLRIERAAQELGYIRDRMAGALHNRFTGTIGIIVPTIDNAIFAELIQAFAARLATHDRTMLIASHDFDLSKEVSIMRSLLERRIDGVALIGLDHNPVALEMLKTRNVPVVTIWNYRADSEFSCIGADNFEGARKVATYLRERSHRDVALVFPPTESNDRAKDRFLGALDGLGITEDALPKNRNIVSLYDIGAAKQAVVELLQNDRPSAIICGNDIIAQGALFACQGLGLKVPDDISIIGIGDFRGSAHMEPSLTTLRLPARRIGEMTADLLTDENFSQHEIRRIAVDSELIERGSVSQKS